MYQCLKCNYLSYILEIYGVTSFTAINQQLHCKLDAVFYDLCTIMPLLQDLHTDRVSLQLKWGPCCTSCLSISWGQRWIMFQYIPTYTINLTFLYFTPNTVLNVFNLTGLGLHSIWREMTPNVILTLAPYLWYKHIALNSIKCQIFSKLT